MAVGMAMMSVVVAKKNPKYGFMPLTYMWCAHTTKLRAAMATIAHTITTKFNPAMVKPMMNRIREVSISMMPQSRPGVPERMAWGGYKVQPEPVGPPGMM